MSRPAWIINAKIVNEGEIFLGDILIEDGLIGRVVRKTEPDAGPPAGESAIINAAGKFALPGIIDDQVHLREPGLTHKGDIHSESRAAVAGGVTSFMDMPNTLPPTLTCDLLEEKYRLAAEKSLANYSFYMGTSNDNTAEVLKVNPAQVCGVKVFMGSSTGNLLVDNIDTLNQLFSKVRIPVAVHCEDEGIIRRNMEFFREKYGDNPPMEVHPLLRSQDACFKSTRLAVSLAKIHRTRLHVLHVSTGAEAELFESTRPLERKRITAEVCVHHLWFTNADYGKHGTRIKWNPAIKTREDRDALFEALLNDKIDVVATDHAPHTLQEKESTYFKAPSGGPLVQHSLLVMLEFYHQKKILLPKIVEKMCHAPALCFSINRRGFIRPGYWADIVLADLRSPSTVSRESLLYKCGWSPFEGTTFNSKVTHTFVNGNLVWEEGRLHETHRGMRLLFDR